MRRNQAGFWILALGAVVFLAGCGGSAAPPPISVSIAAITAQSVDQGQSVTLAAAVANDTSNKGVTWTVSCATSACGVMSPETATSATYTAPGTVTATLSVKLTARAVADTSKSASSTLMIVAPPSVTTALLPDGTGGSAYHAMLQESGGIPPFTWTLTAGSLPAGFSLGSDGTISGTPTAGGRANFTVQVADSGNPALTASANLSINVVVLSLSITTTSLPDGAVDTAYKQNIQASGGIPPYSWSVTSGTLPSWATLNLSTGIINGIPGTTGTANFTVQVADSETTAATSTQALSITTTDSSSTNNFELNGHYAFLFNGFDDASTSQVAIAGSFIADGKGNITAGIEDENGPSGPEPDVSFTGRYNIASDSRGAFTVITASGSTTYALVLNSVSNGVAQKARFVEFDDTTGTSGRRGSGVLRLQEANAFALNKIAGPYAFGFQGQDAAGSRKALIGSFNADGAGVIPSGMADENVAGSTNNPAMTGSFSAPSLNGRATMKLMTSGASTLNLSVYVISAAELIAMTTNGFISDGLVSGLILSQRSASFTNSSFDAPAVYYQLGVNPSAAGALSLAEIGLLSPDGNGNLSVHYDKQAGSAQPAVAQRFVAGYSVLSSGRVSISGWYGDASVPPRILYLLDQNAGFFLDTSSGVGFGFVEAQSPAPSGGFTDGSFSGTFSAATVDPSVTANANAAGLATLDGAGNLSESANLSTQSGLLVDQATSGTYSIDPSGRGVATGLMVTTASLGSAILALTVTAAMLLGRRRSRRNTSRVGFATCFLAIWMATTPAGCPPIKTTNQLVFYVISSQKAVFIHQQSFTAAPEVTIVER
jgi:hypothetical protein